ncbi:MAG: hypothetical protein MUO19_08530 [Dehalococcoidales bacterium]|nr:hypothetical protein [Dehalococcoidales bacterium]
MKRVVVRRVRPARARTGHPAPNGLKILDNEVIKRFNPSMLQLGDIGVPCQEREAVAAVFDLTGFTTFCNQVDAYLAIPRFLSGFLEWFFINVRKRITAQTMGDKSALWAELPMKVKFMGDGLLILWNAQKMTDAQVCRLAVTLYEICHAYRTEFYPKMANTINKPPSILRCGAARGKVFTIGNGNDFVGHCINNASRLSHLNSLTFCFPHRGFPVREYLPADYLRHFVPKHVSVRGVGDNELVWVVRREFDELPEREKEKYRNLETVTVR